MAGGRGKPQWAQSALALTPKAATMMLFLGAPILLLLGCRLVSTKYQCHGFGFGDTIFHLFVSLQLENCVATGCIAVTISPSLQRWILQTPEEHATQNLIGAEYSQFIEH